MIFMDYLTLAGATVAALAIVSVSSACVFTRLWGKPKRLAPMKTPADYGLSFESVSFKSQGVVLRGWFVPSHMSTAKGTIIVSHGWSHNGAKLLSVARQLREAGFAVFLYDARGHGASGSDGFITVRKFADDLIAAIDYLQGRPEVDTERLGVVGHSMGGAAAILAASMEPRIRALVSTSAFADPVSVTARALRYLRIPRWPFLWLVCRCWEHWLGATADEIAPQNRIAHIGVPVLLVHGDADRLVPPSDMETLYVRAPQKHTDRWLAPGRRHSDVLADPEYGARVIEFLRRSLGTLVAYPPASRSGTLGKHTDFRPEYSASA